ncbi:MFS transporter [Thermogemmatispora tikiterensis]|uniref:Major facilitator superfamily (MFS) profile domain-containing protein n=1 Tax=Thermogemmatispora tikiterensis TaxID=1825093 RepID=A0A328VFP4_9CHLR|nr:MFS transporter [Thermogemmatispora tikiterensis]RAQ94373.1 hypothetical protein A4R35_02435 [Thermogemmatispora tikiterensis]
MLSLFRQRNFMLLWFGQLISVSGDWLLTIAIPFSIYQLTGSVLQTGASFMLELLPRIALGSFAGVFVDRWDRRWTMIVADLTRAAILCILLLVHSSNLVWIIYIVILIHSVISQLFTPAMNALLPSLVADKDLVTANSAMSLNDALTRLIGPFIGGILLTWLGFASLIILDSATYICSALFLLLMVLPRSVKQNSSEAHSIQVKIASIMQEWVDGLRVVGRETLLKGIFFTISLLMFAQGAVTALMVVFVERQMHQGAVTYGWLITAQGVGTFVGAIIVSILSKYVRPGYIITTSLWIIGGCIVLAAHYPFLLSVFLLLFLAGIFAAGFVVMIQSLLQNYVIDSYRGRVLALFETLIAVTMLGGMFLASLLGDALGVVSFFTFAGILTMGAGLVALLMLRRATLHPQNRPATETDEQYFQSVDKSNLANT